jgi:serine/threonine protein kinase
LVDQISRRTGSSSARRPQCFSATESVERESRAAASFSDAYLVHELLGVGSFGRVYRATDRQTGAEVAAKMVPLKRAGIDPERIQKRIAEEVVTTCLTSELAT